MKNEMDQPIDFSALDPARDPARWNRRVEKITAAAQGLLDRRRVAGTVAYQMVFWARPILTAAAAIVFAALGLFWYAAREPASGSPVLAKTALQQPAYAVATWALNDHIPNSAELLALNWRQQP